MKQMMPYNDLTVLRILLESLFWCTLVLCILPQSFCLLFSRKLIIKLLYLVSYSVYGYEQVPITGISQDVWLDFFIWASITTIIIDMCNDAGYGMTIVISMIKGGTSLIGFVSVNESNFITCIDIKGEDFITKLKESVLQGMLESNHWRFDSTWG